SSLTFGDQPGGYKPGSKEHKTDLNPDNQDSNFATSVTSAPLPIHPAPPHLTLHTHTLCSRREHCTFESPSSLNTDTTSSRAPPRPSSNSSSGPCPLPQASVTPAAGQGHGPMPTTSGTMTVRPPAKILLMLWLGRTQYNAAKMLPFVLTPIWKLQKKRKGPYDKVLLPPGGNLGAQHVGVCSYGRNTEGTRKKEKPYGCLLSRSYSSRKMWKGQPDPHHPVPRMSFELTLVVAEVLRGKEVADQTKAPLVLKD
ncbi:hypothetical protein J0S82_000686, partial [Galemys pyrenaicus]